MQAGSDDTEQQAGRAAWLMLALLFLAYVFSLFDRMILALLVRPIKADLGVSDTQISLLQGLAFALLYSTLALPIGRLIDRRRRITILAAGIALWSLMTALCGVAGRYWQLFLGRVGVGVGEAVLSPASYSLIADSFPRARLGIATSLFALGASVGAGLSLMVGGVVVHALERNGPVHLPGVGLIQPWQQAFLIAGGPGLALALAVSLLKEPLRKETAEATAPSASDVLAFLRRNGRWIAPHFIAVGLSNIVLFGTTSWIIAFFDRAHGWGVERAGLAAGIASVTGAVVGLISGGALSDLVQSRGPHRRLFVCAGALTISAGAATLYPLVSEPVVAAAIWGVVMAVAAVPIGVAGANLQEVTPGRMRGVVAAVYFFVITLIGTAIGPALIAGTADAAFPGGDGIRYALAIVGGGASLFAAAGFMLAAVNQKRARLAP